MSAPRGDKQDPPDTSPCPPAGADEGSRPAIERLEAEKCALERQLAEAELRASQLADQVALRETTLAWIYSSRVYRYSRWATSTVDSVLLPLRRLVRRWRGTGTPTGRSVTGGAAALAGPPGAAELPQARTWDVFCLPIIDWDFRFQRPQQLLRQFAGEGIRVFYARTGFHQAGERVTCRQVLAGVYDIGLPGPAGCNLYRDAMDESTVERCMTALAALRASEGVHDAVIVVDLPFWAPLAAAMRRRWGWRIVYDCMDDHGGFSTNSETMVEGEASLLRASDVVVATSQILAEKARAHRESVLLIPNAGEHEHFVVPHGAVVRRGGGKPVIGYYGAISDWFDLDLIVEAARRRPDWHFVMIGSTVGSRVNALRVPDNIEFPGELPYSELSRHLHGFDVACIPFIDNELTRATNPVKFFEYLSAGKPVVSVPLRELKPYSDAFYPARDADEFVAAVTRALAEDGPDRVAERRRLGAAHTWNHRYRTLRAGIDELFGRVAIVVVSYHSLDLLRQCIESLAERTLYPDYEVIVVDNASGADVVEWLEARAAADPRLRLILNEDNLGFAKANNQGIAAAEASGAEYVVLLNNDTIVTTGWLFGLVRYLRNPQIGMVGPVTSFAGNEARIEVDYDDPSGIEDFARRQSAEFEGRFFDIGVLAMFCVAMRRSLFEQIGTLDERYGRGMFEDDDFSLRVRAAGYRTVCTEDVFVHHWGEGSFGKLERPDYRALFDVNKQKFEARWQCTWVAHQARAWDRDGAPPGGYDRFALDRWRWVCNVCGHAATSTFAAAPDELSCRGCGLTGDDRALVHVLSLSLFGRSLPLGGFPGDRPLLGIDAQGRERRNEILSRHAPGLTIIAADAPPTPAADFLLLPARAASAENGGERAPPAVPDELASRLSPGGLLVWQQPGAAPQQQLELTCYRFGIAPPQVVPLLSVRSRAQTSRSGAAHE